MNIEFMKSLKGKLLAIFLLISLVPVAIVSYLSFAQSKSALQKEILDGFSAISQSRETAIVRYLEEKLNRARAFSLDGNIESAVAKIALAGQDAAGLTKELNQYLTENKLPVDHEINAIILMNLQGRIIGTTDKAEMDADKSNDPLFTNGKNGVYVKDAYNSIMGFPAIAFSAPIKNKAGELVGVIANRYNIDGLNSIMSDRTGFGDSGESYVVNRNGYTVTDSRFAKDTFLKLKIDTEPVRLFQAQKKIMEGVYSDYRGTMVLGVSNGDQIDKEYGLGWTIMGEMDAKEAFAPVVRLQGSILILCLLIAVVVVIFALKIAQNLANPITLLSQASAEIAKGDLSGSIAASKSKDEIGMLGQSFNNMSESLKNIISKTQDAIGQIGSATSEILAASQQQAAGAREQSAAISETTSAAKELSKSAEQMGESIKKVSQVAAHAMAGMVKIKDSITKTGQLISSLSEKSHQIGKITELIDDVADQTNLLAVNAAIEAARAGEQGRGFSVVADEIRKLSDSTAKSTKDITALIEIIQHEMSNAILAMEESVKNVDEETKLSQESAERAKEISMSATQQVGGSKQIAEAMANIDEAMKQVTQGAQQSQVAAKQLNELGQELKAITAKFKLS
ncbi:MAG: methyl-accepting chemotaxis protein [Candidatus Omnitrophica bacterium]|nr:methyl-accepting chemotaxis protein [Candidatus Omnitrophota bacterium]